MKASQAVIFWLKINGKAKYSVTPLKTMLLCLGLFVSQSRVIIRIRIRIRSRSCGDFQYQLYIAAVDPGNCCLGNEDAVLKAAEDGAGEKDGPGAPAVCPVIACVGVGGGVPPELGKLPPPVFEMLLFTGDICVERSDDCAAYWFIVCPMMLFA